MGIQSKQQIYCISNWNTAMIVSPRRTLQKHHSSHGSCTNNAVPSCKVGCIKPAKGSKGAFFRRGWMAQPLSAAGGRNSTQMICALPKFCHTWAILPVPVQIPSFLPFFLSFLLTFWLPDVVPCRCSASPTAFHLTGWKIPQQTSSMIHFSATAMSRNGQPKRTHLLVAGWALPLWKIMDFVSWEDDCSHSNG
jgi:hypothetical protein